MTWTKLEKHSDWGFIYYALPGKGLTKCGTASARDCSFTVPDTVYVRFPDGHEAKHVVHSRRHVERVSDHGHSAEAASLLRGVLVTAHGLETWVDLADLEIDV